MPALCFTPEFEREGSGFSQFDRIFGGDLEQILNAFTHVVWEARAA